jgi:hypothetical protein
MEPDRPVSLTEVARGLAFLSEVYPNKFPVGPATANVWQLILEEAGATSAEFDVAVRSWPRNHPSWPPTAGELVNEIPRLCRCGKCAACGKRAQERRRKALERGCVGGEDFTPGPLIAQPRRSQVGPAPEQRRLAP